MTNDWLACYVCYVNKQCETKIWSQQNFSCIWRTSIMNVEKPIWDLRELMWKRKIWQPKRLDSLFRKYSMNRESGLEACYEVSLVIAKTGKPHTIGADLIKPALSIFCNNVLKRDASALKSVPLSTDTVRRRIGEMSVDLQRRLHSCLRKC